MEVAKRAAETLRHETQALRDDQQHDGRAVALQARLTSLAEAEVQLHQGVAALEGQRRGVALMVQVRCRWCDLLSSGGVITVMSRSQGTS